MADRSRNDSESGSPRSLSEFAKALLSGDELGADVAIRGAIEAELSQAEIYEELITPALWLIGDLWQRGEITVADEHLATEITQRVLALEQEARRVRDQRKGYRVLLATPSGEHHVVALRMLAGLLLNAGYDDHDARPGRARGVAGRGGAAPRRRRRLPERDDARRRGPGVAHALRGAAVRAFDRVRDRRPGADVARPGASGIEVCHQVSDGVRAVDAIVNRAALN